MIQPSSSEDDLDDDPVKKERINVTVSRKNSVPSNKTESSASIPESSHSSSVRLPSPSPSSTSDEVDAKARSHEKEHLMRLQLYVFVARCIAYPFTAKQPTDLPLRDIKIQSERLQKLKNGYASYLSENTKKSPTSSDVIFKKILSVYCKEFMDSLRLERLVHSGGCSVGVFRMVFRYFLAKGTMGITSVDNLKKPDFIASCIARFEKITCDIDFDLVQPPKPEGHEPVCSKEDLYEMYQNILGINRLEHQAIFSACQLDNSDEQAAAIRRELSGRIKATDKIEAQSRYPKFYHAVSSTDDVTTQRLYLNELRSQVNDLMGALERVPVTKVGSGSPTSKPKFRKLQGTSTPSIDRPSENEVTLSKSDVVLQFSVEVVVMEIQGMKSLPTNREIYCTMGVGGCGEKLQTEQVMTTKPVWDSHGDFTTTYPLPVIKIKLFLKNTSVLAIDDKELGRVNILWSPNHPRTTKCYDMIVPKACPDALRVKLSIFMERPLNLKQSGYLYALGKTVWKRWKKRYFILVQVSQYNFAMCSYLEKKSEPVEMIQLDGFVVNYSAPDPENQGGKVFFNTVKGADVIAFASDDIQEGNLWVQAIYRATGQTHRPVPPAQNSKASGNKAGLLYLPPAYNEQTCKQNVDAAISVNPCKYDHASLFELLQRLTLNYRLTDKYVNLGRFSPGQLLVLEEYCARYGVRDGHRYICHITSLLDNADRGLIIDPELLKQSYIACTAAVVSDQSKRTVTVDEKERYDGLKERLLEFLQRQITPFSQCFPFGYPKGLFKSAIDLLSYLFPGSKEIAETKEIISLSQSVVRKWLHDGALVYYKKISDQFDLTNRPDMTSIERLNKFIEFTETAVKLFQENRFFYQAEIDWFSIELQGHIKAFLGLLAADLSELMSHKPIPWEAVLLTLKNLAPLFRENADIQKCGESQKLYLLQSEALIAHTKETKQMVLACVQRDCAQENWAAANSLTTTFEATLGLLSKLEFFNMLLNESFWLDEACANGIGDELRSLSANSTTELVSRMKRGFNTVLASSRVSFDFLPPTPVFTFLNFVLKLRQATAGSGGFGLNKFGVPHSYYAEVNKEVEEYMVEMAKMMATKYGKILELVLTKLARYDEGTITSSIFNNLSKPDMELAKSCIAAIQKNQEAVQENIEDSLFMTSIFTEWYRHSLTQLQAWLNDRSEIQLHVHQIKTMIYIFKSMHRDFTLLGAVPAMNRYNKVRERLCVEEVTISMTLGEECLENLTMKDIEPMKDEKKEKELKKVEAESTTEQKESKQQEETGKASNGKKKILSFKLKKKFGNKEDRKKEGANGNQVGK